MRLVVSCHLHFWQNDGDLLRATAVTLGWNEYEIRVSTEKIGEEKKKKKKRGGKEEEILSLLLRGPEPGTFRSPVRRSDH